MVIVKIAIWMLAGFGMLITAMNSYLSFMRYRMHKLFRNDEPYRYASTIPLLGSASLWLAAYALWWIGQKGYAIVLLIGSLFDTGGIHWAMLSLILVAFSRKAD